MLVVVVQTSGIAGSHVPWVGRRHDDDGPESTGAPSAEGLFEAVFAALHDGEQVAIGVDCALTARADGLDAGDLAAAAARARSVAVGPGLEQVRLLVVELGRWRPWTIVTTSLPRWRATTSVLLWEAVAAEDGMDAGAAIDGFYAVVHGDDLRLIEDAPGPVLNLAAIAAVESDVTADPAEATRPALQIDVRTAAAAG